MVLMRPSLRLLDLVATHRVPSHVPCRPAAHTVPWHSALPPRLITASLAIKAKSVLLLSLPKVPGPPARATMHPRCRLSSSGNRADPMY